MFGASKSHRSAQTCVSKGSALRSLRDPIAALRRSLPLRTVAAAVWATALLAGCAFSEQRSYEDRVIEIADRESKAVQAALRGEEELDVALAVDVAVSLHLWEATYGNARRPETKRGKTFASADTLSGVADALGASVSRAALSRMRAVEDATPAKPAKRSRSFDWASDRLVRGEAVVEVRAGFAAWSSSYPIATLDRIFALTALRLELFQATSKDAPPPSPGAIMQPTGSRDALTELVSGYLPAHKVRRLEAIWTGSNADALSGDLNSWFDDAIAYTLAMG